MKTNYLTSYLRGRGGHPKPAPYHAHAGRSHVDVHHSGLFKHQVVGIAKGNPPFTFRSSEGLKGQSPRIDEAGATQAPAPRSNIVCTGIGRNKAFVISANFCTRINVGGMVLVGILAEDHPWKILVYAAEYEVRLIEALQHSTVQNRSRDRLDLTAQAQTFIVPL